MEVEISTAILEADLWKGSKFVLLDWGSIIVIIFIGINLILLETVLRLIG